MLEAATTLTRADNHRQAAAVCKARSIVSLAAALLLLPRLLRRREAHPLLVQQVHHALRQQQQPGGCSEKQAGNRRECQCRWQGQQASAGHRSPAQRALRWYLGRKSNRAAAVAGAEDGAAPVTAGAGEEWRRP